MLGQFGSLFCVVETLAFEDVESALWASPYLYLLLASYVFVIVVYYVLVSLFLLHNDAAFLNVSLLTADFYGMFFSYVIFTSHNR